MMRPFPRTDRRSLLALTGGALIGSAWPLGPTRGAALRSFHVSPAGNDGAAGTAAAPWRTIGRALSASLVAGDEVVVAPGTYREQLLVRRGGRSATALGYVTIRSATPGGAQLRPPSGVYSTLSVRASYVIIEGFDVQGGSGHGIDVEDAFHVIVRDNIVHDSGGSGIQFNRSEFITIDGNTCFRNAYTNGYQCSGISVYQCRNITGDASTSGFRCVIRNNISYANFQYTSGEHTDGNGIIIDDFQSTQTSGYPNYTFPTLVENNLCHSNGGKGIQVTWSDRVTVRNNTCWRNNLDNRNPGSWRAELNNQQSSNNLWVNNIGVADPSVNRYNTAAGNQSYGSYRNVGTAWYNNLTFNGTTGSPSVDVTPGNAAITAANGNLLGVNPLFVRPAETGFDFRLASGSPAINAGTTAFGAPSRDLGGGNRPVGVIDIGAYESGSGAAASPPPPAQPAPNPTFGTLFAPTAVPAVQSASDTASVELGFRFRSSASGFILGVRFFKGSRNTGTHRGRLWSSSGSLLADAVFANESASGWQEVRFGSPVAINAGALYVASYLAPRGAYAIDENFFAGRVTSGPLTAPSSGEIGGNGVYRYGSGGFPTQSWRRSNYWVDVIFRT